jgi:hypothetical protein
MNWQEVGLSPVAAKFVDDFYLVLQAWDDFYDGDDMPRETKLSAIWASLVGIPSNPFFQQHSQSLIPLIASLVVRWETANELERERDRLDVAFMWRAGFFDVVLHCVLLERGPVEAMKAGPVIARTYTETIESLRKEFSDA